MNRYQKHILVLPEDDANRQIANGFFVNWAGGIQQSICPVARGWRRTFDELRDDYENHVRNFPKCRFVILIDFDDHFDERMNLFRRMVPEDLQDRIFLLGCIHEPETVRRELNTTFEGIGRILAEDCDTSTRSVWNANQFRHNSLELNRLKASLALVAEGD